MVLSSDMHALMILNLAPVPSFVVALARKCSKTKLLFKVFTIPLLIVKFIVPYKTLSLSLQ